MKTRVAIICGGQSAEHAVSVRSARSVLQAIDRDAYDVRVIVIDQAGAWGLVPEEALGLAATDMVSFPSHAGATPRVAILPGHAAPLVEVLASGLKPIPIDVVFPLIHGPMGEDGTLQGLLEIAGLPFVGSGVLASATCMDKEMTKRVLVDAGLPVGDYTVVTRGAQPNLVPADVVQKIGLPCFVKPASLGSSIGITKVVHESELLDALSRAFEFDDKALVERAIVGREIECAVLGNTEPEASIAGEIVPQADFYSFDAKYLDDTAKLLIPAPLPEDVMARVRSTAIEAYRALGCRGMARVDFFVETTGRVILNEVNTIPGFTSISMYPKLWEATGLPYARLIDKLLSLAVDPAPEERQ